MSGVVGVFALGGSRVPCEPRISEMTNVIAKDSDYTLSFSDHRLRLEAVMDPSLDQSSFQCADSGCLTWLLGYFDNKPQLVSRIASEGAEPHNSAELLTRLYQCKGLLAVPMLRGAFVALIWDPLEQRLVIIRDPLGLRNLYFSKDSDHLWFSTSPKALALETSSLDMTTLHRLILTGSTGEGKTMSHKIETLKPGELMVAERSQLRRSRYWQFLFEDTHPILTAKDCQLQLSQSVDSVLARLGKKEVFLQGAEDDTSVLGLLFNIQSRYPVRFQDYEIKHNFKDDFKDLVQLWGQPFGRPTDICQAMVLAGMQQGQALVLPTGEHILFGCHPSFRDLRWQLRASGRSVIDRSILGNSKANSYAQIGSSPDDAFGSRQHNRFSAVSSMVSEFALTKRYLSDDFLVEVEREGLLLEEEFAFEWHDWTQMGQLQASLMQWELQPSLSQLSRLSLDVGVSIEHPFLDMNLIEDLLTFNPDQHLCGVVGGQLLEQAFASIRQDFFSNGNYRSYSKSLNPKRFNALSSHSHGVLRPGQAQFWDQILIECADILQDDGGFMPLKKVEVDQLLRRCKEFGCQSSATDLRSLIFLASLRIWFSTSQ